MSAQTLEQQTYLPEGSDQLAKVYDFIEAHEASRGERPAPRYLLVGAEPNDSVEIPENVYRVLRQVVEALQAGRAVTVAPQTQTLTTQQAADLLGVSRPTVVKLIDEGKLPADTPGKRRRLLRLDDVLRYRKQRREEQYRAIFDTADDYDLEESPEVVAERLRQVRAEVAAIRQNHG